MKLKHSAIFGVIFSVFFSMLLFVMIMLADSDDSSGGDFDLENGGSNVSSEVLKHKSMVEKYCKKFGIGEYVNYILGIMQVESGGGLPKMLCKVLNHLDCPPTASVPKNQSSKAVNILASY